MRVAFVFLEKLSLDGISFLPQIKTQTMLQKEQILLPALYRQNESAQGFNTSSGLNYLVLLTETSLLSFLYSLGNNHTNDRGVIEFTEKNGKYTEYVFPMEKLRRYYLLEIPQLQKEN